jgi:hypothetical protein
VQFGSGAVRISGNGGASAVGADAEHLETVRGHPKVQPPRDVVEDGLETHLAHVKRASAGCADGVVMVHGLTRDIGMVARGQIDTLNQAKLREQLQCPEHGRPPDRVALGARIGNEVRGGEVTVASCNQLRHDTSRRGQPVTGAVEGGDERVGAVHL